MFFGDPKTLNGQTGSAVRGKIGPIYNPVKTNDEDDEDTKKVR